LQLPYLSAVTISYIGRLHVNLSLDRLWLWFCISINQLIMCFGQSINFKEPFDKRYLIHSQKRTVKKILNNDKFKAEKIRYFNHIIIDIPSLVKLMAPINVLFWTGLKQHQQIDLGYYIKENMTIPLCKYLVKGEHFSKVHYLDLIRSIYFYKWANSLSLQQLQYKLTVIACLFACHQQKFELSLGILMIINYLYD
jgi:hypothetical protein